MSCEHEWCCKAAESEAKALRAERDALQAARAKATYAFAETLNIACASRERAEAELAAAIAERDRAQAEAAALREALQPVVNNLEALADTWQQLFYGPDVHPILSSGNNVEVFNVLDGNVKRAKRALTTAGAKEGGT